MSSERRWRKSTRSHDNGQCVELAHDGLAVRDSKNPAVVLEVSPKASAAFLRMVNATRPTD